MIDRKHLLADLKPLLKALEADLRSRCDELPSINAGLEKEYKQAKDAGRTGAAFEEWRADLITQVAAAWILSCVFLRFLEDNELISPPRISGPLHGAGEGRGMMRARDERDLYFRSHPTDSDRDYLLSVFDGLAKLPGTRDIFGPHNLVWAYRDWLSGDAAQQLIEFSQTIDKDGTGELIHDFTDPVTPSGGWDTRFLGDLYQDLSEAARKKYALLQTPIFVEEFILERTLEPAISEFGLQGFKMIDPACGSGHFLLGSFARSLARWRKEEPGTNDRELVNRALASVHGVDLNPYAVAIARFRLLIVAMRECQITRLKDAPAFALNLVCGDSLLHGSPGAEQTLMGFHELAHVYESEDLPELRRILTPGVYHAVVANPPYITVKDRMLNEAYRERYAACHGKYSLAVPFFERLFGLARQANGVGAGFVGMITANSFMKREFGKKLIETYLPRWDLTHVIDTAGAYIPGHGTPTVILFGRHRAPVSKSIRAVLGIRGEPATPADPATAKVWSAIISQIDRPGSESDFVSVSDAPRQNFQKHPWSIGGGGAAELKEQLDEAADHVLESEADSIGIISFPMEDGIFLMPSRCAARRDLPPENVRPMLVGDILRDWTVGNFDVCAFPYDRAFHPIAPSLNSPILRYLWVARTSLANSQMFGRQSKVQAGYHWYEFGRLTSNKLKNRFAIACGEVSTYNHFVLDRESNVFKNTAQIIKLADSAEESAHLCLLGLLNSSTAAFWLKQVCQNKGSTVDEHGARQRTMPFEDFYQFNGTKLQQFPVPWEVEGTGDPLRTAIMGHARDIDILAQARSNALPSSLVNLSSTTITKRELDTASDHAAELLQKMIAKQEELDWLVYRAFGLLGDAAAEYDEPPPIGLGERAFEIVMARRMVAGTLQTEWFRRHNSTPITDLPSHWPDDYRSAVEHRIKLIETNKDIALIEQPEYKRRWNTEPWENMEERALREWLLSLLESYFDRDGRMNEAKTATARGELHQHRLTSVAKIADLARADKDFMQVAELYTGRMDFDVGALVGELVAAESVPVLPVLRYKPAGLEKRAVWERTWELQREEDELARRREAAQQKIKEAEEAARAPIAADIAKESALADRLAKTEQAFRDEHFGDQRRELSLSLEQDYLLNSRAATSEGRREAMNLSKLRQQVLAFRDDIESRRRRLVAESEGVADAQVALAAIPSDPEIAVPPKYTSADFLSSDYWRLRGKLDVPKERWVSFPHCEGEDGTLVIAWAGYDHLQLARAIAERYELAKELEGRKLVPLLAAIGQLIPWLKQWHNELDPAYGTRMGDYFENYLAEEAKAIGKTVAEVMAWTPPAKANGRGRKKKVKA